MLLCARSLQPECCGMVVDGSSRASRQVEQAGFDTARGVMLAEKFLLAGCPEAARPAPRLAYDWVAVKKCAEVRGRLRSEEHTSELQSLMRTPYAVFFLK